MAVNTTALIFISYCIDL